MVINNFVIGSAYTLLENKILSVNADTVIKYVPLSEILAYLEGMFWFNKSDKNITFLTLIVYQFLFVTIFNWHVIMCVVI